jgi:iron complex outermembrane receptor protein
MKKLRDAFASTVSPKALMATGAAVLFAFSGGSAFAQNQAGDEIAEQGGAADSTEIVVTATRRAQSLKDTPVAIGVTSGESLTRENISSFQDLTRIQPALVVNNQGTSGNQFVIRGVLSDIGATTGFYVDEVPLVGGGALEESGDGKPGLRLHDVERIEVLKGPQGTLFGAGSLAGTLRIIVNKPKTSEIEGGGGLSVGFIDGGHALQKADAYFNLPLSSTLAVRATGWGEFGGGYIDQKTGRSRNLHLSNVNDREVLGGRFQMLFEPTDAFRLLASATYQSIKVDGTQAWTLSERPYLATTRTQEPYSDRYTLYSLTGEYDTGVGTITAIGSYAKQYGRMVADSTLTGEILAGIATRIFCAGGVPAFPGLSCPVDPGLISYVNTQHFKNYTAELRFASKFDGPFQIVTGGYFERDVNNSQATAPRADPANGLVTCHDIQECSAINLRKNIPYAFAGRQAVDQWAVYGQVDWKILDTLTMTAGVRYYSADSYNSRQSVQGFVTGVVNIIDTPALPEVKRTSDDSPSYALSLLYEMTPTISFYARAASGFRLGGPNGSVELAEEQGIVIPPSYGSDSLWSYEIGGKAYLLDRKIYTELTLYQMDWSDQQIRAADRTGTFDYVVNAGRTRIRGAEFSLNYNTDRLTIGGGVAFTDAKLTRDLPADVVAGGTIGLKGDRMPRVPRWNASAQMEYRMPLGNGEGYLQSNIAYRGSSHYSFNDQNRFNDKLPAYTLIGAAVGWRIGPADLGIFAENLTNGGERAGLSAKPDATRVYAVTPRTIGLRGQFRF